MDDDDLKNFDNVCRLFPLPGVVLFPHSILPLHIFEPRYRQMTEDALGDDKLVTIVQLHADSGPAAAPGFAAPKLHQVACLGRILQHERRPDGRFNFLLLGRKRVRLKREIPTAKLYRLAEVEVIEDHSPPPTEEPVRSTLIRLFRQALETRHELDPEMANLLENTLPLGVLTDIIAHALGLPSEVKQTFLAETNVAHRCEGLREVLQQTIGAAPDLKPFPPPFSRN